MGIIGFIDGAINGYKLIYMLRLHDKKVKKRLERFNIYKKTGIIGYKPSGLPISKNPEPPKIKSEFDSVDKYRSLRKDVEKYEKALGTIKIRPIWERTKSESGIKMWDSIYRLIKTCNWSIDESDDWKNKNHVIRLLPSDYPKKHAELFFLNYENKDYEVVTQIRNILTNENKTIKKDT